MTGKQTVIHETKRILMLVVVMHWIVGVTVRHTLEFALHKLMNLEVMMNE